MKRAMCLVAVGVLVSALVATDAWSGGGGRGGGGAGEVAVAAGVGWCTTWRRWRRRATWRWWRRQSRGRCEYTVHEPRCR